MAEAPTRMYANVSIYKCPACKKDVGGRAVIDLDVRLYGGDDHAGVTIEGALVGTVVERHDCAPKAKRTTKDVPG